MSASCGAPFRRLQAAFPMKPCAVPLASRPEPLDPFDKPDILGRPPAPPMATTPWGRRMPTPSRVFAPTAARIAFGAGPRLRLHRVRGVATPLLDRSLGSLGPSHTGSSPGLQALREPTHCRPNGLVAGLSNRYTGVSTVNGQNVWYSERHHHHADRPHRRLAHRHRRVPIQRSPISSITPGKSPELPIEGVDNNYGQGALTAAHNGITTEIGLTDASHNGFMGLRFQPPSLPIHQKAHCWILPTRPGFDCRHDQLVRRLGMERHDDRQDRPHGKCLHRHRGVSIQRTNLTQWRGPVAGFSKAAHGREHPQRAGRVGLERLDHHATRLHGGIYTGSAGPFFSDAVLQNAAGHIVGHSSRYSGVSTSRGRNAWIWERLNHHAHRARRRGILDIQRLSVHALLLNEAGYVAGTSSTVIDSGLAEAIPRDIQWQHRHHSSSMCHTSTAKVTIRARRSS